ncbi:MAG: hypothetical protein OXF08_10850 [Bacteroidetes bacterium]|nr:hypothetical protein [Bacteroidota bacterium]
MISVLTQQRIIMRVIYKSVDSTTLKPHGADVEAEKPDQIVRP